MIEGEHLPRRVANEKRVVKFLIDKFDEMMMLEMDDDSKRKYKAIMKMDIAEEDKGKVIYSHKPV